MRARDAALAALISLSASPALAQAEGAVRERTGPLAQPPPAPTYAEPAPALGAPPLPTAPVRAPAIARTIREIRIVADPAPRAPVPPPGWTPPAPSGDLRLEHAAGQALDQAWVARQFAVNGAPENGGLSRTLALAQVINRAFLSAGYINSGLIARPSPDPAVLELRLVYGGLASSGAGERPVTVEWVGKARGLDAAYVEARMAAARRRPLSAVELERDFRLLAEDPAIRTVGADLRPGERPGEASLVLRVDPQPRFDLYVTAANNRSPAVGGERAAVGGYVRNAVRPGDVLGGEVGITEGVEDVNLSYATPVIDTATRFQIRGSYNRAAVVSQPLALLDIRARDRAVEGGFNRKFRDAPLLPVEGGGWRPASTLSGGVLVVHRRSSSHLGDEPFAFSPGFVDGRSEYTAIRLVGDYLVRSTRQVFAVSLTATRGVDGTRSNVSDAPQPDPHFNALLAQVNYARLLEQGIEMRARLAGQIADSVLYSGERFSAGGATTVRGFRENLALADKGVTGSLEFARPLKLSSRRVSGRGFNWDALTASVFADGAILRNHRGAQPEKWLAGIGLSLLWTPSDAVTARATYGQPLKTIPRAGTKDIQDDGFYFAVTVRPLRLIGKGYP